MKRKLHHLIGIFALALIFFACKKEEIRGIEKEEKRLMGTWQVNTYKSVTIDTLSQQVLQSTSLTDVGTIEFIPGGGDDASTENFFKRANFHGTIATLQPCGYFRSVSAGDPINDGWSIFWDADPESKRLLFWAVTGGGGVHQITTLEVISAGKQKLTLVTPYANQLNFVTIEMSK